MSHTHRESVSGWVGFRFSLGISIHVMSHYDLRSQLQEVIHGAGSSGCLVVNKKLFCVVKMISRDFKTLFCVVKDLFLEALQFQLRLLLP